MIAMCNLCEQYDSSMAAVVCMAHKHTSTHTYMYENTKRTHTTQNAQVHTETHQHTRIQTQNAQVHTDTRTHIQTDKYQQKIYVYPVLYSLNLKIVTGQKIGVDCDRANLD